jgi:hypothetical protein
MVGDLVLLQKNPHLNLDEDFFKHYLELLQRIRHGQGEMYRSQTKFRSYYEQQVAALNTYKVFAVSPNATQKGQFIKSMDATLAAKYSNAFTRNEIVVLCCLLSYPGLTYTNIDQKTSVAQKSSMMRGMSFVPPEIEAFFHTRLRLLGVIDEVCHPEYMQPLSAVVLNSTYCYRQLVTWGYAEHLLSSGNVVFTLQDFPDFLNVNGMYVRVQDGSRDLYAKVMSKAAAVSLGISPDLLVIDRNDYARVIAIDGLNAKILSFLSVGMGEDEDPIFVAAFKLKEPLSPSSCVLQQPRMFSHLDAAGTAVYQDIDRSFCPSISVVQMLSNGNVSLEYGPNLISRCVPVPQNFQAVPLTEQAAHCDGNYCCAKGQWTQFKPSGKDQQPGHGMYRASNHVPAKRNSDMCEPIFLNGRPSQNSMSFMFNVNGETTLTFPPDPSQRRTANVVDDVPFGGFSAFG